MEPTVKKQKVHDHTPLILQLPSDAFFHIYSFADPSDLFFAIPFVCKTIYHQLKKLSVSEEKLQQLLEEFSKSELESAAKRKQHKQKLKQAKKQKKQLKKQAKKKLHEESEDDEEEEEEKEAATKDDDDEKETKSNEEESSDPKPITAADFFSKHSATEENLVWKQKCLVTMPSLKMIQQDHLYCYRRLFMKKHIPSLPVHYHEEGIHSIVAKMEAIKETTIKKMLELVKQDSVAMYQQKKAEKEAKKKEREERQAAAKKEEEPHKEEDEKMKEEDDDDEESAASEEEDKEGSAKKKKQKPMVESEKWKKAMKHHEDLLSEHVDTLVCEIKEMSASAKELSPHRSKRAGHRHNYNNREMLSKTQSSVKEHEDIIRFLQDTVIITSDTSTDPKDVPYRGSCCWKYESTIELVSPVNGAIVRFSLEYSIDGTSDDHTLGDVNDTNYALTIQYRNATGRQVLHEEWTAKYRQSSLNIKLKNLWNVVQHLGLDTLCGEDAVLKTKLAHRLWHDVIQSSMLADADDDFNSFSENVNIDIPAPPKYPRTPLENYMTQDVRSLCGHNRIIRYKKDKDSWELLTPEEKQEYEARSKKQEAKYKKKISEFEQKCQEAFQHL